jgi:hypothetical protein
VLGSTPEQANAQGAEQQHEAAVQPGVVTRVDVCPVTGAERGGIKFHRAILLVEALTEDKPLAIIRITDIQKELYS